MDKKELTHILKSNFDADGQKHVGSWVLAIFSLPTFVGWIFPLLMCVIRLASFKHLKLSKTGVLMTVWRKDFSYSTTLGRGIVFSNKLDERKAERIAAHERVHIRQFEDYCLYGLLASVVVAILGGGWLSLLLWPFGMFLLLMNFVSAILRFGVRGLYRDSEHERSAYAQTDYFNSEFEMWEDSRNSERFAQKGIMS